MWEGAPDAPSRIALQTSHTLIARTCMYVHALLAYMHGQASVFCTALVHGAAEHAGEAHRRRASYCPISTLPHR